MEQNLFTFTSLRSAVMPDDLDSPLKFIYDDEAINFGEGAERRKRSFAPPAPDLTPGTHVEEIFLTTSQFIYKSVFCDGIPKKDLRSANDDLVKEVLLRAMPRVSVSCDGYNDISFFEEFPYIAAADSNDYQVLYNKPFGGDITRKLLRAYDFFKEIVGTGSNNQLNNNDREDIAAKLADVLELDNNKTVIDFVFERSGYQEDFKQAKKNYFEHLYTLYVARRMHSVDLEPLINIIRAIHLLDMFAEDYGAFKGHSDPDLSLMLSRLSQQHSGPVIKTIDDIDTLLHKAMPVIHPLFGLLHHIKASFNMLKPIGVADLKVVKSKLIGYKPSEISHIQNILKGETNDYTFRELNKTEELFSLSSETSNLVQKENQSTAKNELKSEIDEIIKSNLSVNAGTNVSYKNSFIDAGITAGMAYTYSKDDSAKSAANMVSEILDKAVSKVEEKSAQQRTATKTFETEATNKHTFENTKDNAEHISGIYRWVDKLYEAQVYNYGKRLMYEFVIPEPSAFFVKSRLANYSMFGVNCPEEPTRPVLEKAEIKHPSQNKILMPGDITKPVFQELMMAYDLEEFVYPTEVKTELLVDKLSGKSLFAQYYGDQRDAKFISDHYEVELKEPGYDIFTIQTSGNARFWDQGSEAVHSAEKNRFALYINGRQIIPLTVLPTGGPLIEAIQSLANTYDISNNKLDVSSGKLTVDVEFNDVDYYNFSVLAYLRINPDYLFSWQVKVYNKIRAVEQTKIDELYQEELMNYNSEMSAYRNKKEALGVTTVNDLLQGKHESYNAGIINTELKKSCISFFTREFDSQHQDDMLPSYKAIVEGDEQTIKYPKFKHDEEQCGFENEELKIKYPVIALENAKKRGSFIQFIEQAFEWDKLSYIFYPYFWADQPEWVELMNREDMTDSKMSAFLKAGSARVLVAVTPAYNNAVLHFLATGQIWEGGSTPVIGDKLFIPLYEEIKESQDDLQDAKPEGKPYKYRITTQLVYLQDSSSQLPEDFE